MCRYFLFLSFLFLDESVAIGVEEFLEVLNLLLQLIALVGVGNKHPAVRHFHDLDGALDVRTPLDGIGGTGKWFVLHQFKSPAMVNKGVAGNTRLLVIGL